MKKIIKVIKNNEIFENPPIWIMRQAGRYLPEYLEIRKDVKSFLDFCYNPKLASEVTLQPIRRFDFDAAIIFSDILVIPDAIGVKVEFLKNEGPKLGEFNLKNLNISNIERKLNSVFEAISLTKSKLANNKALIGFCGAPWTLACYMIEGGSSKNFEKVRRFALEKESEFQELIDILCESLINYLSLQIKAGADLIKIFDSWAGVLPESQLQKWVINPIKKIIFELKKLHPEIPVIAFPRGIATFYPDFVKQVGCDCIALDQNIDRNFAVKNINCALQGNLDNFTLAFSSKTKIEKEVKEVLNKFSNKPFIFNLGHGILPQTPIENVELLVNLVRNSRLN